jgi:excinuclease ABC subunit A
VTGVSGSGKSTLAFDTLYAEGQRRFVASLSSYARLFLEQLPRPEVDRISDLPPAVAIGRRNRVTGARSSVGTATEILDLLRVLYARVGETRCPSCDRLALPGTVESVSGRILERLDGERATIGAPILRQPRERPTALRERLAREGWNRILDDAGGVRDVSELSGKALDGLRGTGLLVVDRLVIRATDRRRLSEAVAAAFARGGGRVVVVPEAGDRAAYRNGFGCDGCAAVFPIPEPALFSYNSPLGACPGCQGFGRVPALDRERVVPDPAKSLAGAAIAPFASPSGQRAWRKLLAACRERGTPVDVPFERLSDDDREYVFRGGEGWSGVQGFFDRLERKRYKVQNRVLIARYRRFDPCPECAGARLRPEALGVTVRGKSIATLARFTLEDLAAWLARLDRDLPEDDLARAGRLLVDLRRRVATALEVGLGYLPLDRATRTLSGGEAQRIQLAAALGGTLTGSLYVLDEPSVGLHARDVARVVGILERICAYGNTVVVVEHAPEVLAAAAHVIDLGPGAGSRGGRVVVEGSVEEIRRHPESLTGRVLRGETGRRSRTPRPARGALRVVGARAQNLDDLDVTFPLGNLIAVTGVSGAGKSTLVRGVLVGNLLRDSERGACTRIEGIESVSEVVVVDASPPSRSPRSNPATVSKAFEGIRRHFAATREARAAGFGPGWFSFNVRGGRCESCEGAGEVVVDMHFLDDVRVPCEACAGRRYRKEVLDVTVQGLNIVDVLALGVDEARERFAADSAIADRLEPLSRVGLGYLALGQPVATLSSGESQRLRLAQALAAPDPRALIVLDEPTTGLHAVDVEVLLAALDALVDAGGTVLVVEHNLDVIARADHVIDLGPEGGPGGGRIVATGTPGEIAACTASFTGRALAARADARSDGS